MGWGLPYTCVVTLALVACDSSKHVPGNSSKNAEGKSVRVDSASVAASSTLIAPNDNMNIASIEPTGPRVRPAVGLSDSKSRGTIYMARARKPIVVLGAFRMGRITVENACLVVRLTSVRSASLAVVPPDAKLVYTDGVPSRVVYGRQSIAIGSDDRIPGGGGTVATKDLVQSIPERCPRDLFAIGG